MSFGQGQGQGGGSGWVPAGSQGQPDWNALAADAERQRGRRRAWLITGGVLAAVAIGTVVAFVIAGQGGDDEAGASGGSSTALPDPSESGDHAGPSFAETTLPPLPEPREFISDADKDLAPFEPGTFFAGDTMEVEGRTYTLAASDATEGCADAVTSELAAVLTEHDCATLLRATYTADGVAVTVGVAQFPGEDEAAAAREDAGTAADANGEVNLLPLTGGGAPDFCGNGGCRITTNQVGRYAYFTIAGNSDGTPDSGENTPALQASQDGNDHAFSRIIARGEAQASASASAIVEERNRNNG
ncbi:hypothetical protein [Streptomyces hoynatensis]|uniref:Uncharacterized protein n=1 Tax=Streptomyces hoynatensis TaxID=1141874 RepID=A0A3A9ZG93_9ACTN|nr:hypothetical protein [Streptomyces hoynatensis]RKN46794.1 hypothetical protein D7294_00795 [Streptomyces hoynatensis]